jgi:glycosyltransferase involved in cell wall biosynthesis
MAARDAEAYVTRALRSLADQTFDDFEVIVVDDASRDATAQAVLAFGDPRIVLVRLTATVGAAGARNAALGRVRAPLVAVLDADDVAWPERLALQVAFLAAYPDVGVVGGQIRVVDADGRVVGRRTYPLEHAAIVDALPRANPLAHSAVMVRTELLQAVGGYPAIPATHDYALWCEMERRGVVFANLPAPLVDYRVHRQSIKQRRTRDSLRLTLAVQRRYWPRPPTPTAAAYRALEHLLLALPPAALNALFETLRYRRPWRTPPAPRRHPPAAAARVPRSAS